MTFKINPHTLKFDLTDLYFKENGYTLELWFKGVMVHSWTTDAPSTGVGQPLGMLLTLTYSA